MAKGRLDMKPSHDVFLKINQTFSLLQLDLFAFRVTHQLPRFFHWRLDLMVESLDTFQQDQSRVKAYSNPPQDEGTRSTGDPGSSSLEA